MENVKSGKATTFLFVNFIVGFLSDIVLNDLSKYKSSGEIIHSLEPYFKNKSIVLSGVYAGLTIVIATMVLLEVYKKVRNTKRLPQKWNSMEMLIFLCMAFVIGYLIDVMIERFGIFGDSLKPYYKVASAGLWGALAFLFSLVISYFIQKVIIPIL